MKNLEKTKQLDSYNGDEAREMYKNMTPEQIEAHLKSELEKLNDELLDIMAQEKKELKNLPKNE